MQTHGDKYTPTLTVDGANGVGAIKLAILAPLLKGIKINIVNDGSDGILNYQVELNKGRG